MILIMLVINMILFLGKVLVKVFMKVVNSI